MCRHTIHYDQTNSYGVAMRRSFLWKKKRVEDLKRMCDKSAKLYDFFLNPGRVQTHIRVDIQNIMYYCTPSTLKHSDIINSSVNHNISHRIMQIIKYQINVNQIHIKFYHIHHFDAYSYHILLVLVDHHDLIQFPSYQSTNCRSISIYICGICSICIVLQY